MNYRCEYYLSLSLCLCIYSQASVCISVHRLVSPTNLGPQSLMQPHWATNWIRLTGTIDNCQDATPGDWTSIEPLKELILSLSLLSVYVFYPAPSQVTVIRKEKTSRNSVSLSWQQPERPNGIILDYEIKYYEKVGAKYITVNALPRVPLQHH